MLETYVRDRERERERERDLGEREALEEHSGTNLEDDNGAVDHAPDRASHDQRPPTPPRHHAL